MIKTSLRTRIACALALCLILSAACPALAVNRVNDSLAGGFICDCADDGDIDFNETTFRQKALVGTARRIVESVRRPGMSEYDLALALNDWLMEHTQYKSKVTGAYNVLKNGYASCSGYANAYCALLRQANIGHRRIAGKSFRFDHVWNLVRMDGCWYHVDVRMNDSSNSHAFFGLTSEAISYNHQGFKTSKDCSAYACNYDYVNGAYDQATAHIESAIESHFASGVAAFMISLNGDCPAELRDPIQSRMIKAIIESRRYDYAGEAHGVKLSLLSDAIAVYVDRPNVPITSITLSESKIKLKGVNLSKETPTFQLTATIFPQNASNPVIFWRSRNEKVAIVDQKGAVKIVGYGKAEVMAMSEDGSKKTAKCVVTVGK